MTTNLRVLFGFLWVSIAAGVVFLACDAGSGASQTPTLTADPEPATATAMSTPSPAVAPTLQPTATPTSTPEPTPTATAFPMATPTAQPTLAPTAAPTPIATPFSLPTFTPRPPPTATPDLRGASRAGDTGMTPPGMESYDRLIPELMEKWEIPGGAIAVVKDGRLVFAKGYGLADVENKELVQPDSLFRIASISKPITAVAILKLMEDGLLDLDERAFDILDHLEAPGGEIVDPRVKEVTVRQLLQHSGGWDRDASYDPMYFQERVAALTGAKPPIVCEDVIRYMLGQRLDFDPGTQYAYSNFGYCILGRIIEKKTGQSYEEYVRQNVLAATEKVRMQIGGTTLSDRIDREVRYYDYPGARHSGSVLAEGPRWVPAPYGEFFMVSFDALGGWIASPIDLVHFVTTLDGSNPPLLDSETVELMISRPGTLWPDSPYYYGMGWLVRPADEDANWWHNGNMSGTNTVLVRMSHGLTWAALFNSRPRNWQEFGNELNDAMWLASREVTTWPDHDLFPEFGYE